MAAESWAASSSKTALSGSQIQHSVVGIGLNVNQLVFGVPTATSLAGPHRPGLRPGGPGRPPARVPGAALPPAAGRPGGGPAPRLPARAVPLPGNPRLRGGRPAGTRPDCRGGRGRPPGGGNRQGGCTGSALQEIRHV
ncbi:MAG: hypothetical protein WKG07_20120 [Hymenobacter sp.]